MLITGGAGFIGSHVAEELLLRGYEVRVLDNLAPQVHGPARVVPPYLCRDVELVVADVRDRAKVERALAGVDGVFHFAAAVGVAQSMYAVEHYTSVNSLGTAVLLEAVAQHGIGKLIVASSMSVYGEGLYRRTDGTSVVEVRRDRAQLARAQWEPLDRDGNSLSPQPTPESKTLDLVSVYALSKHDQERLCLMLGEAYGIPVVALRLFNVFGPRQALSNPYTGVLAIFAARLLNDRPPIVFEDGLQRRDFVSVHDVARACRLAYECGDAHGMALNIGSGRSRSVLEVAHAMVRVLGKDIAPQVMGEYRVGDIRHCFADVAQAKAVLGYEPQVGFEAGLEELAEWLEGQTPVDRFAEARRELDARGLTVGG